MIKIILYQIRNLIRLSSLDILLAKLTQGKGYDNFFVKLLPNNKAYRSKNLRKVERQGIHYYLDISDYMQYILYFGIRIEPRDALYELIQEGMTVLDIGAHIGETLLNFAKRNQTGQVYGFEPNKESYDQAVYNISLNNFENIGLHQIAFSDQREELVFNLPKNNNTASISMRKNGRPNLPKIQAITLDQFIDQQQINQVDFIKIDVEGFEMDILKGGEDILRKHKPQLFIEINHYNLSKYNATAKELYTFLSNMGYEIFLAETGDLLSIEALKNYTHFDIICNVKV